MPNTNNGQFRVICGYRITRHADGQRASYLRHQANAWLPRSFRWTEPTCASDLDRYITGLTGRRDQAFVIDCQSRGYVTDVTMIERAAQDKAQTLCRASVDWLVAVAQGHEPLSLPENAVLTLRTDRNGYAVATLARQLVAAGILGHHEAFGKPLTLTPRDPAEKRMWVTTRAPWSAAVSNRLILPTGGFLWSGYRFMKRAGGWAANAVIPGRLGSPQSFVWRHSAEWRRLGQFLGAIQRGSRIAVEQMTERATHVTDLVLEVNGPSTDEITVSPLRLRALLRGEDPLQLAGDDLLRQRRHGNRLFPYRVDIRLIDQRLDILHDRALAARQRAGLSAACARPVRVSWDRAAMIGPEGDADAIGGVDRFSGGNLLAYDYVTSRNAQEALERGEILGATALAQPDTADYQSFTIVTQLVHWPPRGTGTIRRIWCIDAVIWFGWRPHGSSDWTVLAAKAESIAAIRTVYDQDVDLLARRLAIS